ncbi:MAG: carbon starvation protein A [Rickettsiales bacterium]|nr:MAG: carbon starvation protein A [Rickettsiales bacterium]
MNGISVLLLGLLGTLCGYTFYGRWLAKKWGVDEKVKTPANAINNGKDYSPSSRFSAFAHEFSSIAGAGPITGPIIAAFFGWVPVLLWLIVGGVFFGAVQDFGSLYASVKEEGKTMGWLIEKYIGKFGKKLFSIFAWLFCSLVIAAFMDIVAGTFNGINPDATTNYVNGTVASISMLFVFVAIAFSFVKTNEYAKLGIGLLLVVLMCVVGIYFPLYYSKTTWIVVLIFYMLAVSDLPVNRLKEPRDYLSAYLLVGVILASVIGIFCTNPSINLPAFAGFNVNGKPMFPVLFVTIACGAVSGFHGLIASSTTSKIVNNEKDMLPVGYGAMMLEVILAVVALIITGAAAVDGALPKGTPFQIFGGSAGKFLTIFGLSEDVAKCLVTMSISAFALTSLDAVGRIGRMFLNEFFANDIKAEDQKGFRKVLTNGHFGSIATILAGTLLCIGGYQNIWPLFGAANQLCSALILIVILVFLKSTKRTSWTLYFPAAFMFLVTITSLVMSIMTIYNKFGQNFVFVTDGLQLIIAITLIVLSVLIVVESIKKLKTIK